MRWATAVAQRRQERGVIIWDNSDPLPARRRGGGGRRENNNSESHNKVCLSTSTSGSLSFSLSLVSSLPSGSRGICGKTGELRGRREMRLEPLKEVPYRGETSTSQDWFSDGWLSVCVCVPLRGYVRVFGCILGILKLANGRPQSVGGREKKNNCSTNLIKCGPACSHIFIDPLIATAFAYIASDHSWLERAHQHPSHVVVNRNLFMYCKFFFF